MLILTWCIGSSLLISLWILLFCVLDFSFVILTTYHQKDLTMPNIQVNSNGINKLLKGLNMHKATDPAAIPTGFIHDYAKELAPIVACLSVCSNGRNGPLSGCEGHVPVFYKIRT
jgi:hypothetical protein